VQGYHVIIQAAWQTLDDIGRHGNFSHVVFANFQHDDHDATESLLQMQLCQIVLDDMDVGG
jgi:hypothetical protein